MAFLCPVRIGRSKKKKSLSGELDKDNPRGGTPGMGRITGSASIETLVRVGIEKENGLSPDSKMVVLHDFTPCVDDELQVKRGQIVNILYRENDWVYVISSDTRQEGFIPHSYCTPYNSQHGEIVLNNMKKKLPREPRDQRTTTTVEIERDTIPSGGEVSDCESFVGPNRRNNNTPVNNNSSSQGSLQSACSSQHEVHPFLKDPAGRYIVLYTFIARDENDLSVQRGEYVTVLNKEDPDWYWIERSDGQEGFVPSAFVYPADVLQGTPNQNNLSGVTPGNNSSFPTCSMNNINMQPEVNEELRYHGTELVMLYDYKAQAPDDLSVRRGDWIYADLTNQTIDGWLWAYAPKTRKYGFIPKAYARPPAMTSL